MKRCHLMLLALMGVSSVIRSQTIFDAVRTGDMEAIKLLIENSPRMLDSCDGDGMTALHLAAREGSADIITYFLGKGAKTETRNNQGKTALHLAATFDRTDAVEALVEGGAALETRDPYGRSAFLLCARERGGTATANILLDAGADVNAADKFDETAIGLATWRGKKEMVDLLLRRGAVLPSPGDRWGQMVSMSASKGMSDLFLRLIREHQNLAGIDAFRSTLLNEAARGGAVEIVDALLQMGFSPSATASFGWTPLHYAALDGRTETAQKLIEHRAPLNARTRSGQSPWNVAKERGMDAVASLLASKGADTGAVEFPALEGDYLGQKPPGESAELFAPGIISSIWGLHSTAVFAPDGNEVLWAPMVEFPGETYSRGGLLSMKRVNGRWTAPQWASFSGPNGPDDVPFFSSNGRRLYFISLRPLPGESQGRSERIWYVDRTTGGWSEPQPLDPNVNSADMHWEFSLDNDGNLYFGGQGVENRGMTDIYVAPRVGGNYEKPVNVGEPINSAGSETTPFIAPDGSYLLFSRQYDLYVSFRGKDGRWSEPVMLGPEVNSPGVELCPIVTPDGRYLFFLSTRGGESHAYWVRADFIERMKKQHSQ